MATFETLSVTGTATAITATLMDNHEDGAMVVIESGSGRFRADGTAPTATVGVLVSAGDVLELFGGEVPDFKLISADGATVTATVHTFIRGTGR